MCPEGGVRANKAEELQALILCTLYTVVSRIKVDHIFESLWIESNTVLYLLGLLVPSINLKGWLKFSQILDVF
jgi:hypothetical protein